MRVVLEFVLGSAAILGLGASAWAATWAVRYDLPAAHGVTVDRTSSGGFVTATVDSVTSGILVVAVQADGSPAWQRLLVGTGRATGFPILRASGDGGYFIADSVVGSGGGWAKLLLARLDAEGAIVWQRTSSTLEASAWASDVLRLADGGCLVVAMISTNDSTKLWLTRTDGAGGTVWSKTFDAPGTELGGHAIELPNGDLVIASATSKPPAGLSASGLVFRIGADGSLRWQRSIEGPTRIELTAVAVTPTGEILTAGSIGNNGQSNGQPAALLVRLSGQGGLIGSRAYRGPSRFDAMALGPEGRIVLAGQTFQGIEPADGLVVITDAAGAPIVASLHGGAGRDALEGITPDGEGGFVVSGLASASFDANPNLLVERLDASGLIGSGCPWTLPRSVDADTRPLSARTTSIAVAPFVPAPSALSLSDGSASVPGQILCSAP